MNSPWHCPSHSRNLHICANGYLTLLRYHRVCVCVRFVLISTENVLCWMNNVLTFTGLRKCGWIQTEGRSFVPSALQRAQRGQRTSFTNCAYTQMANGSYVVLFCTTWACKALYTACLIHPFTHAFIHTLSASKCFPSHSSECIGSDTESTDHRWFCSRVPHFLRFYFKVFIFGEFLYNFQRGVSFFEQGRTCR